MLKNPFVFVFNILETQHAVFRTQLHDHIRKLYNLEGQECIFLPIRNSDHSTLDKRAEFLNARLREFGSAHVVALSVAGLDCRLALSRHSTPLKSLFTISAPHKGSALATWAWSPERNMAYLDPLCKHLGIPFEAFIELRSDNITRLNKTLKKFDTPFACTSSWKFNSSMCDLLIGTGKILQGEDKALINWNDGVFYRDEMKWENHLLSFDGDHTEIIGSKLEVNCAPLFRLALDNARRVELHAENKIFS